VQIYLKHATKYLYDSNPALVERVYHDREGTAEGPQNPDNDPSSQPSNAIYGMCEEQREWNNDEVKERLSTKKSVREFST
jgi:hypothetical protein